MWNVAYQSSLNRKRASNEPGVSVIEKSVLDETIEEQSSRKSNSSSNDSSCNIQETLHMLINKQLSSSSLKSKQIGVIGALMLIKNMAKRSNNNVPNSDSASDVNDSSRNNSTMSSSQSDDFFSCTQLGFVNFLGYLT